MSAVAEKLLRRFETLKSDRYTLDATFQSVAEYFIPRKSYITRKSTTGEKLKQDLFDGVGRRAVNYFAAGMFANLTPASSRWLNYTIKNAKKASHQWLDQASSRVVEVINQTNWAIAIQDFYRQIGVFGTASMLVEPDAKRLLRFSTVPIEETYIVENVGGVVDTMFRPYKLSAEQIYKEFGDKSGKTVLDKMKGSQEDALVDLLHVILPRYDGVHGSKAAKDKPWASYKIIVADKEVISESGYDYFPCPTARLFKERRSAYGYGIAMMCEPDMKELNKLHFIVVRGGIKQVDPIYFTNDDGILMPKNVAPGSLIKGTRPDSVLGAVPSGGNHGVGMDLLRMKQAEINESFYIDLFRTLAQQQGDKTAYEIQQRVEENKGMIAPLIMPILSEAISPIMETVFSMLMERGEFGDVPDELLVNAQVNEFDEPVLDLGIEYVSTMAMALRFGEIGTINDVLMFAGNVAGMVPSILDKVDTDYALDKFAKLRGSDPLLIIDTAKAEVVRTARAQQMALQAKMSADAQGASTAKMQAEALSV